MSNGLSIIDIEEKVQINLQKDKHTLETLRDCLENELHQQRRITLRGMTQEQNLTEQIAYIDKRIQGRVDEAIVNKVAEIVRLKLKEK